MVYTPTIYDWPDDVEPIDQVFRAGGSAIMGGQTLGGFLTMNPEPGGRGELQLNFAPFATAPANLAASWLISRLMNGNIMKYDLRDSVQLVPEYTGSAPVDAVASKGAEQFTVDLSSQGEVLQVGHVIGFSNGAYDFAHVVMDISYDGSDVATVDISPPLRRDLTVAQAMRFRPRMLVYCQNAQEVMSNYRSGRHMQLNSARLVEALV